MFPNSLLSSLGLVPTAPLLELTTKGAVVSVISRGTTAIKIIKKATQLKEMSGGYTAARR